MTAQNELITVHNIFIFNLIFESSKKRFILKECHNFKYFCSLFKSVSVLSGRKTIFEKIYQKYGENKTLISTFECIV